MPCRIKMLFRILPANRLFCDVSPSGCTTLHSFLPSVSVMCDMCGMMCVYMCGDTRYRDSI